MSDTMIERVARAIVANGIGELCWDVISDEHAEMAMRQARAAIEAMREPDETMVAGAMSSHASFLVGDHKPLDEVLTDEAYASARSVFGRAYTAAIDAALQEKPPTT
jgi:hypothetical protein